MKLLIIRHGDPDYENDSLTDIGWAEAELLSKRMEKLDVKAFYVSPLGRAKATASVTLRAMNREAEECKWLREFKAKAKKPYEDREDIAWDWIPQSWTDDALCYDPDRWMESPRFRGTQVAEEYRWVTAELDKLIASHGYVREGKLYRVEQANEDTIVLVCHFGLQCVLLGHLLGISPMILWHGACAAPTSVTTLVTEERRKGIAAFRMSSFGDISHLYVADQPPAFAARFCETYDNMDQRHD